MSSTALTVSVVVPTFRRPALLARCLDALGRQDAPPDEILVVMRSGDQQTRHALHERGDDAIRLVTVREPGVLAAMSAGAARSSGDIVAFVDDDAAPRDAWLRRLLTHFEDPGVGGAGGRDEVDRPTQIGPPTTDVGRLTRWGRVVGNHHLGTGPPRDVAVLKGVNMAFRREALALPARLRGAGAQVHYEVATCLWAHERGWRLLYDSEAVVDHAVGPRFDSDRRARPDPEAVSDAAFNLVFVLGSFDRGWAVRRFAFGTLVGDKSAPGALRCIVALARSEGPVLRRMLPAARGQLQAIIAVLRGGRLTMSEFR